MIYDAIVVGGGPAGLMASNMLQSQKINYLLLEKNERVGKKILLTGGKRCNVTNNLSVDQFIQSLNMKHKRFLYHALNQFGTRDVVDFFKEKGLNLLLENNFKYFPETHQSQSVVDALLKGIDSNRIVLTTSLKSVTYENEIFELETNQGHYQCKKLLITTGSKAYPSVGSSGDGIRFAQFLGVNTIPFTPAETYVYSDQIKDHFRFWQGIAIEKTTVKILGTPITHHGDLLFTHFGLSGPVILHASEDIYHALLKGKNQIAFPLIHQSEEELRSFMIQKGLEKSFILQVIETLTPHKVAQGIVQSILGSNKRINEISKKDLQLIISALTAFTVKIDRVESIERAFVNAGGVDVSTLDPKSMSVKKIPALYFAGEVTDLQGPIGGFNMTIALSTGRLAASHIAESIKKDRLESV